MQKCIPFPACERPDLAHSDAFFPRGASGFAARRLGYATLGFSQQQKAVYQFTV